MTDFSHFEGTRGFRQARLRHQALSAWFEQHLPGFTGLLIWKCLRWSSNPTYKPSTSTAQYVMRAKPGPQAKLLPSAHAIEREYAVMSGPHGTGCTCA